MLEALKLPGVLLYHSRSRIARRRARAHHAAERSRTHVIINENPRVRKAAQSIGRSLIYMVMARLRSSSRVAEYTISACARQTPLFRQG